MTRRHPIMIIATAQQQQSIHPSLISNHVFTELKHLNPPSRDERKEVNIAVNSIGDAVKLTLLFRSWKQSWLTVLLFYPKVCHV